MRIIKKTISDSGRVHIYVFGIKIISYSIKNYRGIHGVGNDVVVGEHSAPKLSIYGDSNRVRIDSVGGDWWYTWGLGLAIVIIVLYLLGLELRLFLLIFVCAKIMSIYP